MSRFAFANLDGNLELRAGNFYLDFMGKKSHRSLKTTAVQQLARQCPAGTVVPVKMLDRSLLPPKSNRTWENNADIIKKSIFIIMFVFFLNTVT